MREFLRLFWGISQVDSERVTLSDLAFIRIDSRVDFQQSAELPFCAMVPIPYLLVGKIIDLDNPLIDKWLLDLRRP